MSCAELTSWTNMSLLEKRENLASFFHVIKGKRPGLLPPWFSWQIQGGRILRGSARGGDSEEGRSGFCAGNAPKPCWVSARPAGPGGEGGEGRGRGGQLRRPPPLLSCVSSQIACASSAPAPSSVNRGRDGSVSVASHHKPAGSKQQILLLCQLWSQRSEVWVRAGPCAPRRLQVRVPPAPPSSR